MSNNGGCAGGFHSSLYGEGGCSVPPSWTLDEMPPEYADGEVVTYSRNNRFECSPLHIWWRQSRIHCQEHGSAHRVRSHLRAITEGGGGLQLQIASLLSPWNHYDYDRMYDGLQWSMVRQTSPIPERYA